MEYQDLVLWVLEEAEVCSWARLGAMSEERWQRVLSYMPIKNPEVPADLLDRSKFGPGHVELLEDMRRAAYYDVFVWAAFKKLPAHVRRQVMMAWWRPNEDIETEEPSKEVITYLCNII